MRTAGQSDVSDYGGLVGKTTEMFHQQVGLEMDDMRQDLWLTVVKARRAFSTKRSRMNERPFVYGCIANRVKDMKRDAARRSNGRLVPVHIADESFDWFEFTYRCASHEEMYGEVESDLRLLLASLTEQEQTIVMMLVAGYAMTEIALSLGLAYEHVKRSIGTMREKAAIFRPGTAVEHAVAA